MVEYDNVNITAEVVDGDAEWWVQSRKNAKQDMEYYWYNLLVRQFNFYF